MRQAYERQFQLTQVPIEKIEIELEARDDIPALLLGLQRLFMLAPVFAQVVALLETHVSPGTNRKTGRPGMDLWQILVLGVLKQGLNCDFDRLKELADHHETIRQMLGHGLFDKTRYHLQRLIDNVSLLTPELLQEINRIVVSCGHDALGHRAGQALRGRCDSFAAETDVHYPTDVSLLWDAMRCLLRTLGRAALAHEVAGWRQWRKLTRDVRALFNAVRVTRRAQKHPARIECYLKRCRDLVARAEDSLEALAANGAKSEIILQSQNYIDHAKRQIDQADRRLLQGEIIPHEEKVFSIFETHTRWISKGKAGCPVELGVPVCVIEDQHQFILHHVVMWKEGSDVDMAVPMVEATQALFPDLRVCSFDRGFHSPDNRIRLNQLLDLNALPGKGRLSKANQEREAEPAFLEARKQHPAVESAINHLEHHGLDRILSHGAAGFKRSVALSILGANIHRLGLILRKQARNAERRRRRRAA